MRETVAIAHFAWVQADLGSLDKLIRARHSNLHPCKSLISAPFLEAYKWRMYSQSGAEVLQGWRNNKLCLR